MKAFFGRPLADRALLLAAILSATMVITPSFAHSADLWPERLVHTSDQQLRERLLTTHLYRKEPLSALAIVPADEGAGAYDNYMKGIALRSTGKLTPGRAGLFQVGRVEQARFPALAVGS